MKSKSKKMSDNTLKLTVSAIMVALATILSFIKFANLPYGGSVTLFSFVPILFVGYAYGAKWGISAGLVYSVIQTIVGLSASVAGAGFKWWQVALCALLDYIIAGSLLGTAGMFKKSIKNCQLSFGLGTFVACLLKYCSHIISGYVFFGGYAEWFFTEDQGAAYGEKILSTFSGQGLSAIYSIIYNATYMVPETILSIIVAVIIISVKPIQKAAGIESSNKI